MRYDHGLGQERRITAAGLTKAVTFEPVDGPIYERIDDACRQSTAAARISVQ